MTEQEYNELYEEEDQGINFRKYVFLFLSNWYWFALTLAIALGAAHMKNRYTNPTYSTSATIILEDQGEKTGVDNVLSDLRPVRIWRRRGIVENEIAKIKSYEIARRTLEKLNFEVSYTLHGRLMELPKYKNTGIKVKYDTSHTQLKNKPVFVNPLSQNKYQLMINEGYGVDTTMEFGQRYRDENFSFKVINQGASVSVAKYSFQFNSLNALANRYSQRIQVEKQSEESTILTITLQGKVEQKIVDYLNTFCNEYIQYGLDQKNRTAENTMQFIDEQIEQIADSLQTIENQLLSFRKRNEIINLSKEGEMAFERLKNYHSQRTELEFKKRYYNYLQSYLENRNATGAIIAPPVIQEDGAVLTNLLNELRDLRQQRE
ncbi:MAG: hypothetical protein V5A51_06700, partial [Bacteroidales bacterium]